MVRSRVALIAVCATVPLLGACTAQLASHAAKKVLAKTAKTENRGVYKVGTPYMIDGRLYRPAVDYRYAEIGIASWYGRDFHGKRTANGERFDMNRVSAAHRTLPLPSMVRVTNLENGRILVVRVSDRGPFARGRIIDLSRKGAQMLGFYEKGTARVRVEVLEKESRALALQARRDGNVGDDPVTVAALDTAIGHAGEDSPGRAQGEVQTALWRNPDLRPDPRKPSEDRVTVEELPPLEKVKIAKPAQVVSIAPMTKTRLFVQAGAFSNYENASRLRSQLDRLAPAAINPLDRGKQRLYRVRLGPLSSISEADRVLESLASKGHANATIVVEESSVKCEVNASSTLTKC